MATNNAANYKPTQHSTLVGAANGGITSVAPSATSGVPLISQGASADPAYGTAVVAGGGTGLTTIAAHNLIVGNATSAPNLVAPSATSGVPLISQGASADPAYGTAVVGGGGTGSTSFNAYGPVVAAATSTGALTSVSPSATSGIPLVSQGASANPSFSTAVVAGGGTGLTSTTAYAVLCGGTTSTANLQSVSGVGTSAQVLTSNGAAALPTWQDLPANTAYFVYRSSDVTNITGDGTEYQLIWDSAVLNPSTAFNLGTGAFVAPSTSAYHIFGSVLIKGLTSDHTRAYILLYIGGTSTILDGDKHPYNNADVNGATQIRFSSILNLTASDSVSVKIVVSGGTKVADIQGQAAPYCTFCNVIKL